MGNDTWTSLCYPKSSCCPEFRLVPGGIDFREGDVVFHLSSEELRAMHTVARIMTFQNIELMGHKECKPQRLDLGKEQIHKAYAAMMAAGRPEDPGGRESASA